MKAVHKNSYRTYIGFMKQIYYYFRSLKFYACVPRVSMKLLNGQFQYWHFNKYFILFTGTSVMNLFALRDSA